MLSIKNISKSFGAETLFTNVNFNINPGDRLALVGPNGCGKSTLLRIVIGEEKPDSGFVINSSQSRDIGYLPQGSLPGVPENRSEGLPDSHQTIAEFLSPCGQDLPALEKNLEFLAEELSNHPDQESIQEAYNITLSQLQTTAELAGRMPEVLAALGLKHTPAAFRVDLLSGGQKTRLALARVLLSQPQYLLLDEPTNNLDFQMLDWLEKWLINSPCGILFVSHDRRFLETVATGILEIDPKEHLIRSYSGGYQSYLWEKESERERQLREYSDQMDEIARLKAASLRLRTTATFTKGGKSDTNDKFTKGFFANRSLGTVGRAKNIENRLEKMLSDHPAQKPDRVWEMNIQFHDLPSSGRDVMTLTDLTIGYGHNMLISDISQVLRFGSRTALIGPNGCGKTTLLRTITRAIQPLAGEINLGTNVKVGYMSQEYHTANRTGNALTTILAAAPFSETEARAFLSFFLFTGDDVFTAVSTLSYGERARLTLAELVASGCNFLLLDEPVNHLDISSRQQLEQALLSFPGSVLFVVHDRAFIERVATEIWEIRERRVIKVM